MTAAAAWRAARRRPRFLRFRSRPLQARLAILTAVAVAVAVAACALASWLVERQQLYDQLNDSLRSAGSMGQVRDAQNLLNRIGCLTSPDALNNGPGQGPFNANRASAQFVGTKGTRCLVQGDRMIPLTTADKQIAQTSALTNGPGTFQPGAGGAGASGQMHDVTTPDGIKLRVYTVPTNLQDDQTGETFAFSVARPLSDVTDPLNKLALVLAMVTGIGAIGAALAGLCIARAGLKPVDRFTATVEHIARTEDLTVRIPVDGEDEIARLSTAFNSMTSRLAASRELQQQLIADAGHELRTPLTSLRTNIELLERSEMTGRALLPADRRDLLVSVKAQMGELASLIGDLQELSRPESDPVGSPPQTVGFHEVVEAALERARLRSQGVKLLVRLAPWYARAEPAALERAIINLLDNAIKFSPPGGGVEVDLHGGELTVRDHGPGIAPDELPHVFERFWRSTSARSLPGSGLGLSIVARTVQQAGGTVALRPALGGGTVAVMCLPGAGTPPPELA
jgi:two-component system, OmpR family, sensor histidine kinase MprB